MSTRNTAALSLLPAALIVGTLSLGTHSALGQSVVAPTTPVANQALNDSLLEAGLSPSATALTAPLQWAAIAVRPHLHYRYLYGDGIRSGPGQQTKTTIQTISPGVLFEIGSRWSLDYTATQYYYSKDNFRDRLDHSARLNGAAGVGNLGLSLSHRFSSSSSPLAETAQQTKRDLHSTSLNGSYSLGSRSAITSAVNYSTRSSEGSPDYDEWTFTEGFQYQMTPRLKAAALVAFGSVYVDEGTDMSYIRPQAQISWQPTEKISLGLQAGQERRKFKDSDAGRLSSPTYSGSLAYRPFDTTTVVLTASRRVSVSYFQNQVTEGTSWGVSLRQRLLQRFTFSASYNRRDSSYEPTILSVASSREDESDTLSFRLGTQLFERMSVGITYQESNYDSNLEDFAYDSSQFGVEVGYSF
jgi:hypothetical protein